MHIRKVKMKYSTLKNLKNYLMFTHKIFPIFEITKNITICYS